MRQYNHPQIIVCLAVAGLLSACGRSHSYAVDPMAANNANIPAFNTSPTPTPTTTTTPTNTNLNPPYSSSFIVTGNGAWTSDGLNTDNLFKVRISPDLAPSVEGTNFTPNYNCISYLVTVTGTGVAVRQVRTPTLAMNGGGSNCPQAPSDYTIDFSPQLGQHMGSVAVQVSAIQTDWKYNNCMQYWMTYGYNWMMNPYSGGSCNLYYPLANLYSTHSAAGTVVVQINGTSF